MKKLKENEKEKTQIAEAEESAGKPQKKWVKIVKTVVNVLVNVLIVMVLITSILIATMALSSKSTGISTIFGNTIQTIQSDSMKGGSPDGYPGGDFEAGDLVIGKATNYDEFAEYEIGDIVTFREEDTDGKMVLVVHRIVDKKKSDDGFYHYQTWGDNREVAEVPDQLTEEDYLNSYDIGSVIYSKDKNTTVLRGMGKVLDFLRTSQGFFLVVLLPMIIFFLYEIVRVIMNAMYYKKAKAEEDKEDAERDKQAEIDAAVAAALEAQKDAPQSQEAKPDAPEMSAEDYEEFKRFMAQKKAQEAEQKAEDGE